LNARIEVRTPAPRLANPGQTGEAEFVPTWASEPWLTAEKLRSLGFPLSATGNAEEDRRRDGKLLPRDVYVVLELNGQVFRRELQEAQDQATRDDLAVKADPKDTVLAERARRSQKQADAERLHESRLFCIDAGVDATALRKTYPDRSRFAIVRGTVHPMVFEKSGHWTVVGQFSGLRIPELNIPLIYRPVFGARAVFSYADAMAVAIAGQRKDGSASPHYSVSVAWGRRFEPWIVSAASDQPVGTSGAQ
jgi:hypothetical protein